jgi:hypothetical protein
MELNWERWLSKNLEPTEFLQDIEELQDVSVAQKDLHRLRLDPGPHRNDVDWIRKELPKLDPQLRAACLPLRLHDANSHKGVNVEFRLRLIIVCAAREPATAIFTHDLVKILGKFYITNEKLTSGIQMFCYVGGTSLEEHLSEGGSKGDYLSYQYDLPNRERRRVLGRRKNREDSGLLESLMYLWNDPLTEDVLEACYLLDAHLANRLVPMPGRPDEPGEIVVATALALISFITTNADLEIRQVAARRSKATSGIPAPGRLFELKHCLFASFGVAAYSIDHPKLHWLVHSWLMGDFLRRALPQTKGEMNIPGNPQEMLNDDVALQIQETVQAQFNSYQNSVIFEAIDERIMQKLPRQAGVEFSKLVDLIDQKGAGAHLKSILAHITAGLQNRPLEQYLQDYQRHYVEALQDEIKKHSHKLYNVTEAPLTCAYHFLREAFAYSLHEAASLSGTFDLQNALYEQQLFADQLEKVYQNAENSSITTLEARMQKRPTRVNSLGRALLIVAATWVAFPLNIPLFAMLGIGSVLTGVLGASIYTFHVFVHRQMIWRELVRLAQLRENQILQIRQYAHQWALVEFKAELEHRSQYMTRLCEPKGLMATLRDELLKQDLLMKDHTLEHLFLDDELKRELKHRLVDDSIERLQLWNRREHMLSLMVDAQQTLIKNIERIVRDEIEALYQGNTARITDIIGRFLAQRNTQRLDEIYHALSDAAIPFLQYTPGKQDDSIAHLELFGVYGKHEIDTQDIVTQYPHLHVMSSVDKLYWLFMRVYVGIHFDQINFSIATLAPSSP